MFNSLQQNLLNDWQRDFPLEPRPYARMAEKMGVAEQEIIDALAELSQACAISRVGAVVKPGSIGVSTLAAMSVPECRLEDVAQRVSAYREVNHNYEREHRFNLWFVVTASDQAMLSAILEDIEGECGYPVMSLPLVEAYHIDLGFDLNFDTPGGEVSA